MTWFSGLVRRTWWRWLGGMIVCSTFAGCGSREIETAYGRSRGKSINGTTVLAELMRDRGHTTRAAVRYSEALGDWAQVIVRFAPFPGPMSQPEAAWLERWLAAGSGRQLIYIPRDYEADAEFWTRMMAAAPPGTVNPAATKLEAQRDQLRHLETPRLEKAKNPASERNWFTTEPSNPTRPAEEMTAQTLGGPWAEGIDPAAAALPIHEAIRAENNEDVLLTGEGRKLVVAWPYSNDQDEDGSVLIIANGSFLLNAALLNRSRRSLATQVVDWIGEGPRHVAFVEGASVADAADEAESSPFHLLTVEPFDWIIAHLAVFGVLLCLSLAVTLGRSRSEPLDAIERPSVHPVALGAILARTRQLAYAQELLVNYRRWRHPPTSISRTDPNSPSPRRVPRA